MSAKEFVAFLRKLLDKDMTAFINNMEEIGFKKKHPHEWIAILFAWLELSNEEDAKRAYEVHYK